MSHHQPPTDRNVSQLHPRPENQPSMPLQKRQRQRQYSRSHSQQQIPPQVCSPFHLVRPLWKRTPDERVSFASCINTRPYIRCQIPISDANLDSSVVRRRRRTRTTFTNKQIVELEQHFLQVRYPTHSRLVELASKLALGTAQVKVWFKNRRRRHKLQVDQNNENAPVSPSSEAVNTRLQHQSMNSNSGRNDCGSGISNAAATSVMLTPSPSSTASAVGPNEFFRSDPFQSYYYAHQMPDCITSVAPLTSLTHFSSSAHLAAAEVYAPSPLMTTTANSSTVANFFTPPPAVLQQQCHQQSHSQSQSPSQPQPQPQPQQQQHCSQYGQVFPQKVIGSANDTSGRGGETELQTKFDFSFAKPYYTELLTPVTASAALAETPTTMTTAQTAAEMPILTPTPTATVTTMTLPYTEPPAPLLTAIAAYCDDYEPLSPLNDKSSGLHCGGICSDSISDGSINTSNASHNNSSATSSSDEFVDPMGDTTAHTSQIFGPSVTPVSAVATNSHNISSASAKPEETLLIMDQCTDAFSKYTKLSCESHESNYQCTMDTIMHAYINHRNMGSSTQLAYCFN